MYKLKCQFEYDLLTPSHIHLLFLSLSPSPSLPPSLFPSPSLSLSFSLSLALPYSILLSHTFSETNLDKSDVVRRPKRNGTQQKEPDPFEDLLGSPQAVARLRWSQELNPLYDYIRGMKISESFSSQDKGIKLYSTGPPVTPRGNANAVGSSGKKMKKVPSVILEESESDTASVTSPKHGDMVPLITHSLPEGEEEREGEGEEGEGEGEGEGEWEEGTIPMIIPANKTSSLPRAPRRQHNYEDVFLNIPRLSDKNTTSTAGLIAPPPILKKNKSATLAVSDTSSGGGGGGGGVGGKLSLASLSNPAVRRLQTLNVTQERSGSVSPRLGKRQLQRRSRTIGCMDDTEAVTRKQRPLRAADTMKVSSCWGARQLPPAGSMCVGVHL